MVHMIQILCMVVVAHRLKLLHQVMGHGQFGGCCIQQIIFLHIHIHITPFRSRASFIISSTTNTYGDSYDTGGPLFSFNPQQYYQY